MLTTRFKLWKINSQISREDSSANNSNDGFDDANEIGDSDNKSGGCCIVDEFDDGDSLQGYQSQRRIGSSNQRLEQKR